MSGKGCGKSGKPHTPIKSKAERGAMGVAYAVKKGELPMSKLKGPSKEIFQSMSQTKLEKHLKESKGKKLPKKVRK